MRLEAPSLRAVLAEARASLMRFPDVLAASIACGVVAASFSNVQVGGHWLEGVLSLSLTIPLSFAFACLAQMRGWQQAARLVAFLAVIALAGLHFASMRWQTQSQWSLRFVQLSLAAHLLVAFLPYAGAGRSRGFWEFNQSLFTRFATAAVFSGVLFSGLTVAALTAKSLLALEIPDTFYWRLWIAIAFGFNTWFFLAGVPKPLPAGPLPEGYPTGLRLLVQYILIPLVTLYLLILYAYMLKIGVERAWPRGTVGYMVSSFSLLGILSLLLIHPYQEIAETRWTKRYARVFYLALFPLVALLLAAVWRRVGEYGLTERRYLLLVMGFWLAAVAAYFTLSRRRNIRAVPVSAFALALLTAIGPLSADGMARWHQLRRLTALLDFHGILQQGRARPATVPVDSETEAKISGILLYLNQVHAGAGIDAWFEPAAFELHGVADPNPSLRTMAMMSAMDLKYVPPAERGERSLYYWAAWPEGRDGPAVPAAGYDGVLYVVLGRTPDRTRTETAWNGLPLVFSLESGGNDVTATHGGATVTIPMDDVLADLFAKHERYGNRLAMEEMTYTYEAGPLRVQVRFERIHGALRYDGYEVRELRAMVLFSTGGGG